MTEVLQSPSHFPSSQSSSSATCAPNNDPHQHSLINAAATVEARDREAQHEQERRRGERKDRDRERDQLSLLTLLVAAFRKSLVACSNTPSKDFCSMEIGWPSNVRHVAHVTFDRFNGFLGLPVEFEPEVPRRAPSASANVFGVSTESMQLSFDSRGNSVPTILLLMQRHLYAQGGLQAEGIFRINAENSQEEIVREQLNRGVVPVGVDVHCLAGLIKAWFRELPTGVLDSLPPEQVMESQTEEECAQLVRLLPPTEASLLDWAINLMADVVQLEHINKMNARNVAMVFAPNMTQMADPLTALMYAVQVMNFLKTLIIRTLREREDSVIDTTPALRSDHSDENGHHSPSQPVIDEESEDEAEEAFSTQEPTRSSAPEDSAIENESHSFLTCIENVFPGGSRSLVDNCPCEVISQVGSLSNGLQEAGFTDVSGGTQTNVIRGRTGHSTNSNLSKASKKVSEWSLAQVAAPTEKKRSSGIVSRINSRTELVEAWR